MTSLRNGWYGLPWFGSETSLRLKGGPNVLAVTQFDGSVFVDHFFTFLWNTGKQ